MSDSVLLATSSALPAGEEWTGTRHLLDAFESRAVDAHWVVWDDPEVDWSSGLVAIRSTWDYDQRREEFLAWTRRLPRVLNGPEVFAWNTDKSYLVELSEAGVPVVPTVAVDDAADLPAAIGRFDEPLVKPRVGAGGRGVVLPLLGPDVDLGTGPWVVQPLVGSVRTERETSVFVLGDEVVSQARKRPVAGEIRVHESYGGTTVPVPLTDEAIGLARMAVVAAERLIGARLDYARVDAMRLADGVLAVSELELTEPGLYLDVLPGNADAFADLVVARLRAATG